MRLHIFKSGKKPDIVGFTPDPTGANLPAEYGPWTTAQDEESETAPTNSVLAGVGATGTIFAAIQRDGFYVARSETLEGMTGVPTVE